MFGKGLQGSESNTRVLTLVFDSDPISTRHHLFSIEGFLFKADHSALNFKIHLRDSSIFVNRK